LHPRACAEYRPTIACRRSLRRRARSIGYWRTRSAGRRAGPNRLGPPDQQGRCGEG
jgi:hypothetical protein